MVIPREVILLFGKGHGTWKGGYGKRKAGKTSFHFVGGNGNGECNVYVGPAERRS